MLLGYQEQSLEEIRDFPYFLEFDGNERRTPRINEALRLIMCIGKALDPNKKGQLGNNSRLSPLVNPQGFEPDLYISSIARVSGHL